MPALSDHPSHTSVKVLIAADSGSGKTGGLASLIDAGKKVRVLDFDNGVSTLRGYIKKPEMMKNVAYIPFSDTFKLAGKVVGVTKAESFSRAMAILEKGSDAWGEALGPLTSWGPDEILVIDTFSTMGRAALQMVMLIDGKGMGKPEIQHYGIAMDNLEKFIGIITSDSVRCSVIVNTHITPVEGSTKLYPEALGSKLGPKIGRYFDNLITIGTRGGQKSYMLKSDGAFACKTAIPFTEDKLPLETGLNTIFNRLMKGQ